MKTIMDIKFFEKLVPGAPGIYELKFKPFFNQNVIVLDWQETAGKFSPKLADHEPKKGVFVLVEPPKVDTKKYGIYVGYAGVDKREDTPEGEQQTLYGRIEYLSGDMMNLTKIESWDKAILLCDWDEDIRKGTAKSKNSNHRAKRNKAIIDEFMKKEVNHVSKILYKGLKDASNPNWNVLAEDKENYYLPNPDSRRYDYYVGVIIELLQMIAK